MKIRDIYNIQKEIKHIKDKPTKIVFNGKEQMKVRYGTNDERIIEYRLEYKGEKITKIINITENKETVIEW